MRKNTENSVKQDSVIYHTEFMNKKAKEFLMKAVMIFVLWIIFDFVKQLNISDCSAISLIARIASNLIFIPLAYVRLDFNNAYQDYEYWMLSDEKEWFYFKTFDYLYFGMIILYFCKMFSFCFSIVQ